MKKLAVALLLCLCAACSSQEYGYPMHFETLLNDRSILAFDVTFYMGDEEGLEEIKKKAEQLEYGMRIILTQRTPDQIDTPKRIKSVVRKICDSQMTKKVDDLEVTNLILRRYRGLSGYEEVQPKESISRKGLTGQ